MKIISTKMKNKIEEAYSNLIYKSPEDISKFLKKIANTYFKKYPEQTPDFLKLTSPQDRVSIICLGFYLSLQSDDYNFLSNALFTFNRLEYLVNRKLDLTVHSGTDSFYVIPLLNSIAGNDLKCSNYYIDVYGGYAKTGHRFTKVLSNLVYSLIKNNEDMLLRASTEAQQFLEKKNTIYTQKTIEFLLAATNKDYLKMSSSFSDALKVYQKEKSIHQFHNNLYKYVPIQLFGLIKTAELYLGKEFYTNFIEPKTEIWWNEYYNVLKTGVYGNSIIQFDEELNFMNEKIQQI